MMLGGLFLGIWVLLLFGGRSRFFRDPGTFWHPVVGHRILKVGFFDRDPFTFTFHDAWWVPHQWFGEVTMAVIQSIGGWDGLLCVTTALLAGLFTMLGRRFLETGWHPLLVVVWVAVALAASATHFHVRPHVMTILGMAGMMAILTDVESGRVSSQRLFWLIPLFWLWSNTHGGVLGGVTSLALVGLGWTARGLLRLRSPIHDLRSFGIITFIGLACLATMVITPYGSGMLETWLIIMRAPMLPSIIQEHSPTDLADPSNWPFAFLGVVYLIALAGIRRSNWRVTWFLPLVWMVQAYGRVRHAPLFAVIACIAIADLWPTTRWAAWLAQHRPDLYDPKRVADSKRWPIITLGIAGVFVALVIQATGLSMPLIGAGWARLDPVRWPVDLLPALKKYEPAHPGGARIFNDSPDGGYLYAHVPNYRTFVDDRCELFGDIWLNDFIQAGGDPEPVIPVWERTYGRFEFAMTRTGTGFDRYFRDRPDEWERVGTTTTANLYRRLTPTQ